MTLSGRIAGSPGLWEAQVEGERLTGLACVDPSFAEERTTWITPGLFDLQVNGIGGTSYSDPPALSVEALARADGELRGHGVTRYLATVVTRDAATTIAALGRLQEAWKRGAIPAAAGVHLEGPWISSEEGYRGVHQAKFTRDPEPAELEEFHRASGGHVRLVTLAPERPGAAGLIRAAARLGIATAMGHTAATEAEVVRAAEAGLTLSTHLFNGCPRLLDRHRNVVYAQLGEDRLWACFIADGHHVPMSTLRVGLRAKGWERSILVSDIAHISGLPDGSYEMEGNPVDVRDGGVFVRGSYLLSGAARTLEEDVGVLARQSWPGIERALLMATRHPATALGEPDWAALAPGRRGPLALFSWDGTKLTLERVTGF